MAATLTRRQRQRELRTSLAFGLAGLKTDTEFMANRSDLGFGIDERTRRLKIAEAKRNGVNIAGKCYSPQLKAWFGSQEEVKQLALAKGCGVEGLVNVAAPEPENPPEKKRYEVAERCVQEEVECIVQDNRGDVSPKERTQLVEDTRTRLRGNQDD
jgi:hypothetical protein